MKAIRVHAPGGPDALRYEDIERPAPGPGQVLVKIEAAGVNFIDIYQRTGHYKVPLPVTLGQEAAGAVSAGGPGVAGPQVGGRGAYARDRKRGVEGKRGGLGGRRIIKKKKKKGRALDGRVASVARPLVRAGARERTRGESAVVARRGAAAPLAALGHVHDRAGGRGFDG